MPQTALQHVAHEFLVDPRPGPLDEQSQERVDVILMLTLGKDRRLFDEVVDPRTLRNRPAIGECGPREVHVARLHTRFTSRRPRALVGFGFDGEKTRELMS
jgi:hypothetical protein